MDTRSKILSLEAAVALRVPLTLVTGTFEVLRAEHTRELAAIRKRSSRPLLVAVLPCASGLLSQQARAELVAALRVVDYVLAASAEDLEHLQPAEIVRLEDADAQRMKQLIEHVRHRHAK